MILLPFIGKPPIFDGGLRKPIANWAKRMGVLTGELWRLGGWREKVGLVAGGYSTGTRGPWTPIIHTTPGLPPTSRTLHFLHLVFFQHLAFLLHLAFFIAHPSPLRTPMRPHCHTGHIGGNDLPWQGLLQLLQQPQQLNHGIIREHGGYSSISFGVLLPGPPLAFHFLS